MKNSNVLSHTFVVFRRAFDGFLALSVVSKLALLVVCSGGTDTIMGARFCHLMVRSINDTQSIKGDIISAGSDLTPIRCTPWQLEVRRFSWVLVCTCLRKCVCVEKEGGSLISGFASVRWIRSKAALTSQHGFGPCALCPRRTLTLLPWLEVHTITHHYTHSIPVITDPPYRRPVNMVNSSKNGIQELGVECEWKLRAILTQVIRAD